MRGGGRIAIVLVGIAMALPGRVDGAGQASRSDRARATAGKPAAAIPPASDDPKALAREVVEFRKSLAAMEPKDPYIVVDTHRNMISYRSAGKVLHEALCSTGCDSVLKSSDGRTWLFATPTGTFRVKRKINNPTWVKPDWAFIEEGKPVPRQSDPDRFDDTAMGSYALDFGNGYYIHGTLYRRLLGENITHGCVRVADEDLAPIFEKAKIGTLVLIY